MPNYEYQCKTCEYRFEIWQPVGEAPPPCEKCGAEVKKIFQPPRLHFKGSGFYVTDLAAEKKSRTKTSETKSEDTTETKSEPKTETATPTPASDAKSDSSGPGSPTAATT